MDFVSVPKNVHQQNRLIHSNLKELFQIFKITYSDVKISYSNFWAKWCILPSVCATHSVCAYTYHQKKDLPIGFAYGVWLITF